MEWAEQSRFERFNYPGIYATARLVQRSSYMETKKNWFRVYIGEFIAEFAAFALSIISVTKFVLGFS